MSETTQRDFLDPAVLGRLLSLPLNARSPMLGNVAGRHRSPVKGSSLEFAQYRKYVPGDDTRRLDWRTWGRTDRYYIKEFEADTNLRLCLIADTSGSMDYETGGTESPMSRLQMVRQLSGSLAYLAAHQGDAVGIYSGARGVEEEIPPRRGPSHLGVVLDQIGSLAAGGETNLVAAMHEAAEKIPSRALIAIFSDLLFDPEPMREALQHLRFRKHDVALFHLLDRQEVDFEFDRPTRFVDLEGGPALLADPSLIEKPYREAVGNYLAQIDEIVSQLAIDYHRVWLDEPHDQILARFLIGRTPRTAKRNG
ncbi:MAG: DUF58 domain-containing protein [Verrucomicrobiota bacterium]